MPHAVQTTRALLQRPFIAALPPQKIQVRCNSGSFFMILRLRLGFVLRRELVLHPKKTVL